MKILAIRLKNLASLAGPFEIDFTGGATGQRRTVCHHW
ncbi:hypothetical protein PSYJA_29723, partial [Pseudomonas syringae pv. japonica str. M301072]